MKKRFLIGFITGALSVIFGSVILFVLYYQFASSDKMEQMLEKKLWPHNVIIANPSCDQSFEYDLLFHDNHRNSFTLNEFKDQVVF